MTLWRYESSGPGWLSPTTSTPSAIGRGGGIFAAASPYRAHRACSSASSASPTSTRLPSGMLGTWLNAPQRGHFVFEGNDDNGIDADSFNPGYVMRGMLLLPKCGDEPE